MWPLLRQNKSIYIIFSSTHFICCSLIYCTKKNKLNLNAYQKIAFDNPELPPWFNTKQITHQTKLFLKENHIKNAFISICLDDHSIFHEFKYCKSSEPNWNNEELKNLVSTSLFLNTTPTGLYTYYLCNIAYEQLLAYKLFSITLNAPLITLTTRFIAQFYLYKTAQKTMASLNTINSLQIPITQKMVRRFCFWNSTIQFRCSDLLCLSSALGLFLIEREAK